MSDESYRLIGYGRQGLDRNCGRVYDSAIYPLVRKRLNQHDIGNKRGERHEGIEVETSTIGYLEHVITIPVGCGWQTQI